MKKILFLSPLPPPYYGSAISSEFCLNILKKSKRFLVHNIKLNYSEDFSDVGKINLKKLKGIFEVSKKIKKEIKEFKPDIIYFMPATYSFGLIRDWFFLRIIKKILKREVLIHLRTRTIKTKINNFFYKKIFTENKVIVLGESLKEDVFPWVKEEDVFVLPNAIKNEVSSKDILKIIKKRENKKSFNILFLSNMDKDKGWPKLLKSCNILNEKNFDFHCFFAGEFKSKKDKEYFENFLKEKNLKNKVIFLGKVLGEEKRKLFEKSNILVFPTEYKLETFGRVIVEAMMYGLPVIANSIASISEIVVDGKTGFLLKENSPEEIAEKIIFLSENSEKAKKMGLEGRKRFLNKYEEKKYAEKFLEIISNS